MLVLISVPTAALRQKGQRFWIFLFMIPSETRKSRGSLLVLPRLFEPSVAS